MVDLAADSILLVNVVGELLLKRTSNNRSLYHFICFGSGVTFFINQFIIHTCLEMYCTNLYDHMPNML